MCDHRGYVSAENELTFKGVSTETLVAVAEGLDIVVLSNDEVLVQFGTRSTPSFLLRDSDLKGILGSVIGRLLSGPASTGELLSILRPEDGPEGRTLVSDLIEQGIVTRVSASPVEQYLQYTFDGDGDVTLGNRTLSVIGLGPVGARLANSLLQHGLGKVTLLDDRKADKLWYSCSPFGRVEQGESCRPVGAVLRDQLRAAGCAGSIEALDDHLDAAGVELAVTCSDFTVVALERPNLRLTHLVNRFCIRDRKPWMLAAIDGNFGLVGPLFLPGLTACYNDYRTLAEAAIPSSEMARKHRQYCLARTTDSFFPGLPAYADIVAGHSALAIVHFMLRETSFALGRVLVIDFDRMTIDTEDVLKLPRCPACGGEKAPYQPAFAADIVTGLPEKG